MNYNTAAGAEVPTEITSAEQLGRLIADCQAYVIEANNALDRWFGVAPPPTNPSAKISAAPNGQHESILEELRILREVAGHAADRCRRLA